MSSVCKPFSVLPVLLALLPAASLASTATFINEIHYDNAGGDVGEGIEVAGVAGTTLDGWSLEFYNGSTGAVYSSVSLSGTISDQAGGFGAIFFAVEALQNGAPDGVALVDGTGSVLQFLSYEGAFMATAGPAAGLTSEDIGVAEASDTPVGLSLQLVGVGSVYEDFGWAKPALASYGQVNHGQDFAVVPLPAALYLLGCALAGLVGLRRQSGDRCDAASSSTHAIRSRPATALNNL